MRACLKLKIFNWPLVECRERTEFHYELFTIIPLSESNTYVIWFDNGAQRVKVFWNNFLTFVESVLNSFTLYSSLRVGKPLFW